MKVWTSEGEPDLEQAANHMCKLLLTASAQESGVFEALREEQSLPDLKKALHADERGLFIVLEALCSLGYVDKVGENRYVLTERARALFLEPGREYVGRFLPHFMRIMKAWFSLPEIIQGRLPEEQERDVASFMSAMASRPDRLVEESVNHCLARKRDARCLLDLGGGPGKYAKCFVRRGLKVVLYDTPDVIEYVSTAFGLKDMEGLRLMGGDFTSENFVEEFEDQRFDIVFMGNISHIYSEEENRRIIEKVSRLLGAGGMIAIEDFVRGRSTVAELFAVNMLANTRSGNTYTEAEYRCWLEEAGFGDVEVFDLAEGESQIITAFLKK